MISLQTRGYQGHRCGESHEERARLSGASFVRIANRTVPTGAGESGLEKPLPSYPLTLRSTEAN